MNDADFKRTLINLQNDKTQLNKMCDSLKKELDKMKNHYNNLKEEKIEISKMNNEFLIEKENLEKEIKKLKTEKNDLNLINSELKNQHISDINNLNADIDKIQKKKIL